MEKLTKTDLINIIKNKYNYQAFLTEIGKDEKKVLKADLTNHLKKVGYVHELQHNKPKREPALPEQKNENNDNANDDIPDFLRKDVNETINDEENDAENETEISAAKLKIQRYLDRFPFLRTIKYQSDEFDYIERLQETENKLNSYNMSKFISSSFLSMVSMVEDASNKYVPKEYVNLRGYTNALAQNQDLYDVLDEISIKWSDSNALSMLSPERRLGLILLSSAYMVSRINQFNEQKNTTAKQEVLNEYNDL